MGLKILLLFFLVNCSQQSVVSIKSTPSGATVKSIDADGEIKELGETPISINSNEVFAGKELVKVVIEKKDFSSESVLLVKPDHPTDIKISSNLKRHENISQDLGLQKLEQLTTKLGKIQNLIYQKNFEESSVLLKELERDHSGLSIIYDMQGNIAYLKGEFNRAVKYYQQADEINPMNPERSRIIKRLKSMTSNGSEEI
jgi:hypothetical protein